MKLLYRSREFKFDLVNNGIHMPLLFTAESYNDVFYSLREINSPKSAKKKMISNSKSAKMLMASRSLKEIF
jgi:hypothetical protein